MLEFFLELYSEEIPPQLQITARKELKDRMEKLLNEESLKYKSIFSYSSPTRLAILIKEMDEKVKIPSKEIKGPKVGVVDDILNSFMRAHNANKKDIFQKENEKGKFYFIKTKPKEALTKDLLIKITLNSIGSLNWRKSMKWANNNLLWGRPLRNILAIFDKKTLQFSFGHLKSASSIILEQDLDIKYKKVTTFKEYQAFLKKNNIILDQNERRNSIIKKFHSICKVKNFKEQPLYGRKLLL